MIIPRSPIIYRSIVLRKLSFTVTFVLAFALFSPPHTSISLCEMAYVGKITATQEKTRMQTRDMVVSSFIIYKKLESNTIDDVDDRVGSD